MITTTSVTALDTQLNTQIETANDAAIRCAALAPADATGWSAFYGAWTAVHSQWSAVKHSVENPLTLASLATPAFLAVIAGELGTGIIAAYFAEDLYNNMLVYNGQLPTWQAKIHAACPSYALPPAVLVQPPPSDKTGELIDKATHAVEVVGGIGIAAVIAVGVFKIINFIRS